MFGKSASPTTKEISVQELAAMLAEDRAIVIDVREPDEFGSGHIRGAINMPLSRFDPRALPDPIGKQLVLQCAGGKRSALALEQCGRAGSAVDTHLYGGIAAWNGANFPVVTD